MDADDRSDEMPYAGIASYYKAPYLPRPGAGDADVAVLGVPYDGGTSARSGARMGPRALRDASTNWAFQYAPEAFWDGEAEVHVLGGVSLVDSGDVVLGPSPTVDRPRRRDRASAAHRRGGSLPLTWAAITPSPSPR